MVNKLFSRLCQFCNKTRTVLPGGFLICNMCDRTDENSIPNQEKDQ